MISNFIQCVIVILFTLTFLFPHLWCTNNIISNLIQSIVVVLFTPLLFLFPLCGDVITYHLNVYCAIL